MELIEKCRASSDMAPSPLINTRARDLCAQGKYQMSFPVFFRTTQTPTLRSIE